MSTVGDALLEAAAAADGPVLVVAPFVKVSPLRRMLEALPADTSVTCVTRWVPEEIAAGISDHQVWTLFRSRPGWQLRLRGDLHAKYYRFGSRLFAGSANVTGKAFGWSPEPNLELLLPV